MNWRRFIAQCHEFKDWLQSRGLDNHDRIILNVLILAGQKPWTPRQILAAAASPALLWESVLSDNAPEELGPLPDEINKIIDSWRRFNADAWFMGGIFEKLAVGRRAKGIFYTDPEIIDFIIDHTVRQAEVVANPDIKVLDPACGCGFFLLKAYDVLLEKYRQSRATLMKLYPNRDWSDGGIHRHIISRNLWGADINPLVIEVTGTYLMLKKPSCNKGLTPNLLVCDSLKPECSGSGAGGFLGNSKYHYVIGNPPYVSFGLRGVQKLEPDYDKYLRTVYSSSAEYKLSYYAFFVQRGIDLLVGGGKLGYIVPDSFLLGRYYSKLRKYILEKTAIEELVHISAKVFRKAVIGMSAICILTRQDEMPARQEQLVNIRLASEKSGIGIKAPQVCYAQSYFGTLPHNRFRLFPDLTVKNLIDKIDTSSRPLAEFVSGHSGIRSKTRQADVVGMTPQDDSWHRGLVSGSQIQRFRLEYRGHLLNINAEKLYSGGWDPAVIGQRKILIRQTGYNIVACIDDNHLYHLNNIHSFVLRNQKTSLDYLTLILNSRLMAFYYHAVTMEYGRAMAQTDIETLELLPVRLDGCCFEAAPALVSRMMDLVAAEAAGDLAAGSEAKILASKLDQLVYGIYGLTAGDVDCVNNYEDHLTEVRSR